jgi:hypothetical protein
MSNIIAVPLNKLTRSARNVRKSGGESIDDLASSILVHGLIHNLTVVEQLADNRENSGKYETARAIEIDRLGLVRRSVCFLPESLPPSSPSFSRPSADWDPEKAVEHAE